MSDTDQSLTADAVPAIRHDEAMRLTATENERFAALLGSLSPEQWDAPTECTGWTVRDLVVHVVASAESQASPVEFARQARHSRRLTAEIGGVHWVDGLNEAQLRARRTWTAASLPERWREQSRRALASRRSLPAPVRALPLLPIGTGVGVDLGWKPLGYLFDVGFTRDLWVHRGDVARAVGAPLELTPEHDGRIVADILREWAQVHGHAFALELTGPAGGAYTSGPATEPQRVDAVEFVRILSGRSEGVGALVHKLPL